MAENQERDPIVEFVSEEFKRYEIYHSARFEEARKIARQWMNEPPTRSYSWQNAINVPLMVEGEQTITPRLFTALFPTDAPVDVHVEGDAPEEQGVRIKGIIQHYFRVAQVQAEALPMLTQNTLFGTGYLEGGSWFVKKGWQEKDGQRNWTLLESRPDAKAVDFFEMYPHPAKQHMWDTLPLIRRRWIDEEALKALAVDSRFDFDKLKEALESKPVGVGDTTKFDRTRERDYEVLEYWGPYDETIVDPTKNDGKPTVNRAVPYWCIVINRTVKLRGIPNPYNHQIPPYLKVKLFEGPKPCWFGVGIGTIGKPTQERVNKLVNQRLDNVDLVLNKQGFYNGRDQLLNKKKLKVSMPGQWHGVEDTATSVRWMDTPDVTQSSYKEEELAKQDFREATGATANLMPEVGSEHRTAMGIQLLQGAAGMRFRPVLRKMEIDFIHQLSMFFFSNLKQFMTEPEWVLVTGKQGQQKPIEITPEQLQAKVFFIPTGISETMNKETQVGQLLRFKEITMNDPTVNRQEINRRVAELLGFKDIQALLTPARNPQQGGLDGNMQQRIQQRVQEGASPEQIKQEMLGPRPQPQAQGAPQQ